MSEWPREVVESAGYSIQYTGPGSETSPLLSSQQRRQSKCIRIFWVAFLVTLFCMGVGIGCYLIIEEDTEYPANAPFMLMSREGWRAISPEHIPRNIPKYSSGRLSNLAITQTTTENCDNTPKCSQIINDLQLDHLTRKNLSDIAYNFIVGGDGITYEARGWKHEPEVTNIDGNRTFVIAFLGDFTFSMPPSVQIEQCKVLIKQALKRGVLNPCYTLQFNRERPQNGGGQLWHVFNRLVAENNKRKTLIQCL